MIDIVRMWRFLRIFRIFRFRSGYVKGDMKVMDAVNKLARKRTCLLVKEYGELRAINAYYMARAYDYIGDEGKKLEKRTVYLKSTGVTFSTHTALINNLAKSIASVSSLVAVVISALALYVAITRSQ